MVSYLKKRMEIKILKRKQIQACGNHLGLAQPIGISSVTNKQTNKPQHPLDLKVYSSYCDIGISRTQPCLNKICSTENL